MTEDDRGLRGGDLTSLAGGRSLAELEAVIQRNLDGILEAGAALLEIRERRLYRPEHGGAHLDFSAYLRARWPQFSRTRAYQAMDAAELASHLVNGMGFETSTTVDVSNEAQLRELAPLRDYPERLPAVLQRLEEQHGSEPTAAQIRQVVMEERLGFRIPDSVAEHNDFYCEDCSDWFPQPVWQCPRCGAHSSIENDQACRGCGRERYPEHLSSPSPDRLAPLMSSDSPEWYTPGHIVARVQAALGGIDLDPCADAERSVPAERHYTADDDGLGRPWSGRVYMNPPYGRGIDAWIERLCDHYARGYVSEAVALVPARVDTQWWKRLKAFPVCFLEGRLNFSEHENSAPFPSAVVYLGQTRAAFFAAFGDAGSMYVPHQDGEA